MKKGCYLCLVNNETLEKHINQNVQDVNESRAVILRGGIILPGVSVTKIFKRNISINAIKSYINIDLLESMPEDIKEDIEEDDIEYQDEDYADENYEVIPLEKTKHDNENFEKHEIVVIFQKDDSIENPEEDHIYKVGVKAEISNFIRFKSGAVAAIITAVKRVKIDKISYDNNVYIVETSEFNTKLPKDDLDTLSDMRDQLVDRFVKAYNDEHYISRDTIDAIKSQKDIEKSIDMICFYSTLSKEEKYRVFETESLMKRIMIINDKIKDDLEVSLAKKKINNTVQDKIEKNQKEFFLHEQMKAIQKELGDDDFEETKSFEERIKSAKMPQNTKDKMYAELKKLKKTSSAFAESGIIREYLESVLSMPWSKMCEENKDIILAESILNKEHYGFNDVKDRILEYIAVYNRLSENKDYKSNTILCLVGPPGVGKTSLAKSVANSLSRPFVKVSLGGVGDESDIRGHRRTYVAAMPGRIIQAIRSAKVDNPVILLDEIDKVSRDNRGDPVSALLEVLDFEQNQSFRDHYLDVEYDISKVIFIATANSFNMPDPLINRMEIIQVSGYTTLEKLKIAQDYLISNASKSHGVKEGEISISDDAIIEMIKHYTKESGVRSLSRQLSKVIRKIVKNNMVKPVTGTIEVLKSDIKGFLGLKKYQDHELSKKPAIGVIHGLAWSEVGGSVLSIEAVSYSGKGNVKITGNIGKVMEESIHVAISFIKNNLCSLIRYMYINFFKLCDFYNIEYRDWNEYIEYIELLNKSGIKLSELDSLLEKISNPHKEQFMKNIAMKHDIQGVNLYEVEDNSFAKQSIEDKHILKLLENIYGNNLAEKFINRVGQSILQKISKMDFHMHIPEGAIPKDGPSAGVCMIGVLSSIILQKPIRGDFSMTGEISLHAKVLPIGGLKEKILASAQEDITNILIPHENCKDIYDIVKSSPIDKVNIFATSNIIDALSFLML